MAEYITLLGAEQVQRAAGEMSSAAHEMNRAAMSIDGAMDRFERLVERFEAAVDRLVQQPVVEVTGRTTFAPVTFQDGT